VSHIASDRCTDTPQRLREFPTDAETESVAILNDVQITRAICGLQQDFAHGMVESFSTDNFEAKQQDLPDTRDDYLSFRIRTVKNRFVLLQNEQDHRSSIQ
jgi:hypothetical protein